MDLSGIEFALVGIHTMLASMLKEEHWKLDPAEAASVAKAIENVARHYPAFAKSQKIVDWVMLAQTLGFTYGPRVYMSAVAKKKPAQDTPLDVDWNAARSMS